MARQVSPEVYGYVELPGATVTLEVHNPAGNPVRGPYQTVANADGFWHFPAGVINPALQNKKWDYVITSALGETPHVLIEPLIVLDDPLELTKVGPDVTVQSTAYTELDIQLYKDDVLIFEATRTTDKLGEWDGTIPALDPGTYRLVISATIDGQLHQETITWTED